MLLALVQLWSGEKSINFLGEMPKLQTLFTLHTSVAGAACHTTAAPHNTHTRSSLYRGGQTTSHSLGCYQCLKKVHTRRDIVSVSFNKAQDLSPQGQPPNDFQNIKSLKVFLLFLQRAKSAFTSSPRAKSVYRNGQMSPDSSLFHRKAVPYLIM